MNTKRYTLNSVSLALNYVRRQAARRHGRVVPFPPIAYKLTFRDSCKTRGLEHSNIEQNNATLFIQYCTTPSLTDLSPSGGRAGPRNE
eukprot:scaffold71446_cov16-Prasinocladus_malaysianus.AAC.1